MLCIELLPNFNFFSHLRLTGRFITPVTETWSLNGLTEQEIGTPRIEYFLY
jgi:hypothetical protein